MSNSIHTARWISQITSPEFDIHLFPSIDLGLIHEELKDVTVYHSFFQLQKNIQQKVILKGIPLHTAGRDDFLKSIIKKCLPLYRSQQLRYLIKKLKPDIIHSLETQSSGYLMLEVGRKLHWRLPSWIHTIWGSDIFYFGQFNDHEKKIREVFGHCNFLITDCQRDITLARQYGFCGTFLGVFPGQGGFDIATMNKYRQSGLVSQRNKIIIKGYQGWAGRALVVLKALEQCINLLQKYELIFYLTSPEVRREATFLAQRYSLNIKIIPPTHNETILKTMGGSRISIAMNITDGVPNSLLESMIMGAFPIQSDTISVREWIKPDVNGFLVNPNETHSLAAKLRQALRDDELVDRAAYLNGNLTSQRIDQKIIKPRVVSMYKKIVPE